MSVNHFSSDFPQTLWWPQLQQHEIMESLSKSTSSPSPSPSPSPAATNFWPNSQFFNTIKNSNHGFDLNNNEEEDEEINGEEISRDHNSKLGVEDIGHNEFVPKLPLFEKPLTPSDVGKLNRLVIPKQHAEKHFPINGGVNESGEKGGLLLSFEDELGKPWRFRYSYWNSSQSYVLTKGWSRFVKEKKLDAGDIVQFQRHPIDSERMFIGWRKRRSDGGGGGILQSQPAVVVASSGGGGWRPYPVQVQVQPPHHHGPAIPYPPDSSFHAGGGGGGGANGGKCSSKRGGVLRLFGVNMECGGGSGGQQQGDEGGGAAAAPISDDSGSSAASSSNQQGPDPAYYHNRYHYYHANYDHTTHADVNFPRDMTRYQQG